MRYSKTVILFIFTFSSFLGFSQENDLIEKNATAYRNLINYIPTNLRAPNPNGKDSTEHSINNILTLWMQNDLVSYETDRKLMDQVIKQLASEFFTDGKMVLLHNVGGYLGCPDKSVDTIQIKSTTILKVPLCASCHDIINNRHLVHTFNLKMYELMQIDPPTENTELFYGEYKGFDENKNLLKLIVKEDRSFQFWKHSRLGHSSDYSDGYWKHDKNILILNSRTLKAIDSISFALQSGRWVELMNTKWILKHSKLKSLDHRKRVLKKEN